MGKELHTSKAHYASLYVLSQLLQEIDEDYLADYLKELESYDPHIDYSRALIVGPLKHGYWGEPGEDSYQADMCGGQYYLHETMDAAIDTR